MDKPGPNICDKSFGTGKDSGSWAAKKKAVKLSMLGAMLIFGFSLSIVVGIVASRVGIFYSVIACLSSAVITTMIGMAFGGVQYKMEADDMREMVLADRKRGEDRHCREIRDAIDETRKECYGFVDETRKECCGFVVEASRAVANRVANRLLARYAPMLAEAEHREATLQETDEIVDEEIAALQQAVGDETESQKDS